MYALRYLNKYFYKYRARLLFGVCFTIAAKIFAVIAPSLVGDSISKVNEYLSTSDASIEKIQAELIKNILFIIGAALISGGFTFTMRQTIINVSRFIECDLKNDIYQHYQRLSLNFYKRNRTGDLMSRISEDVSKVRMYVGPALMYSINTFSLFVIVISHMVSIAPKLTLYSLMPLPILSFAIYKLSRLIHQRSTVVQEYLSKLAAFAQETFSGISVIKSTAIEPKINSQMEVLSGDSKTKNMQLVQVQAWFFPLMILLIGISNIMVIFIGGNQFIQGDIDLGILASFIIYINMLTWPVATVGWVTSIIQQAAASQKRINEFLSQEPEIQNNRNSVLEVTQYSIDFVGVQYQYEDTNIIAIDGLNLSIKEGETLAIMGRTGSGKSTLLNLIGRLYDPTHGNILIDQKRSNDYKLESLRGCIGYVPQHAFLFSDTIANNIRFGNPEATQEEIENAAKQAAVHDDVIHFLQGYETVLGERGVNLSGGQKQRISIARALLKNPKVLLMDDSLSAVDTETEEQILQNLKKVTHGVTVILVSHRISSAKNADKILVLEKGKSVQFGTHKVLVNSEGYYKELYTKQRLEKI